MHDPMHVVHEIKYPWRTSLPWPKKLLEKARRLGWDNSKTWCEMTTRQQRRRDRMWPEGNRRSFITIWHLDPETDGSDRSCSNRHRQLPRRIHDRLKSLAWTESQYPYFLRRPGQTWQGSRTEAETLYRGLILVVAHWAGIPCTFDQAAKLAAVRIHTPNCLDNARIFCFQPGYHTNNPEDLAEYRQERFLGIALQIASDLYLPTRRFRIPPKWHVHHWRIQIHPLQALRRRLFDRCELCGKRFKPNEPVISTVWERPHAKGLARLAFWRSTTMIRHDRCSNSYRATGTVPHQSSSTPAGNAPPGP